MCLGFCIAGRVELSSPCVSCEGSGETGRIRSGMISSKGSCDGVTFWLKSSRDRDPEGAEEYSGVIGGSSGNRHSSGAGAGCLSSGERIPNRGCLGRGDPPRWCTPYASAPSPQSALSARPSPVLLGSDRRPNLGCLFRPPPPSTRDARSPPGDPEDSALSLHDCLVGGARCSRFA